MYCVACGATLSGDACLLCGTALPEELLRHRTVPLGASGRRVWPTTQHQLGRLQQVSFYPALQSNLGDESAKAATFVNAPAFVPRKRSASLSFFLEVLVPGLGMWQRGYPAMLGVIAFFLTLIILALGFLSYVLQASILTWAIIVLYLIWLGYRFSLMRKQPF